jgi:hypothetical protein
MNYCPLHNIMTPADPAEISNPPSESLSERASKIRRTALMPSLSAPRYEDAWLKFMAWKAVVASAAEIPDEEMLLVYLDHLADRFAPSSLWTIYSMLKRQMLVSLAFFFIFQYLTIRFYTKQPLSLLSMLI